MEAPDKIFLQACGSCPLEGDECKVCKFEELEEITWNTERVFKKDVEYIRKDALLEWLNKTAAEYKKRSDEGELVWQNWCAYIDVIKHLNEM